MTRGTRVDRAPNFFFKKKIATLADRADDQMRWSGSSRALLPCSVLLVPGYSFSATWPFLAEDQMAASPSDFAIVPSTEAFDGSTQFPYSVAKTTTEQTTQ